MSFWHDLEMCGAGAGAGRLVTLCVTETLTRPEVLRHRDQTKALSVGACANNPFTFSAHALVRKHMKTFLPKIKLLKCFWDLNYNPMYRMCRKKGSHNLPAHSVFSGLRIVRLPDSLNKSFEAQYLANQLS